MSPPVDPKIDGELEFRLSTWRALQREGRRSLESRKVRALRVYGGAQGIWIDKARTGSLTPDGSGIAVSILHTGKIYADDLRDDEIIYHYPETQRPSGRDLAEIDAVKAAGRLVLPVFVITHSAPDSTKRDIRLGWVRAWDDNAKWFLIEFGDMPAEPIGEDSEGPFIIEEARKERKMEATARLGQAGFKFRVIRRYGPRCALCGLDVKDLLDAAHLRPVNAKGSDDPRNGLVICVNHHRALDRRLFAIHPEDTTINFRPAGPNAADLRITHKDLLHLPRLPHPAALAWLWDEWKRD